MQESQLADIARNCYAAANQRIALFDVANGLKQLDFVTSDTTLKGKHRVDALAQLGIEEYLAKLFDSGVGPFNIYFEDKPILVPGAVGSVFFDEVCGSLNKERKTGNPSLNFGYTSKTDNDIRLKDIEFALVKSYATGDEYSAFKGRGAKFFDARTGKTVPVKAEGPTTLKEAVAYLRTGYGKAREQLVGTLPLFLAVKDIRAFDNTGIELCEIARGAAHLAVDTRNVSDTQNLLPYLIMKEAGAELTDMLGNDIGYLTVNKNRPFNFIAALNKKLIVSALNVLKEYREGGFRDEMKELSEEILEKIVQKD